MTENLTTKLAAMETQLHQTEGTSEGANDNKLAYLRMLSSAITREDINTILVAMEAMQSAARVTLEANSGSITPIWTGLNACTTLNTSEQGVKEVNGRTYANITTLPFNSHETTPEIAGAPAEIHINNSPYWQGTKIFVRSSAPTFRLSDSSGLNYPTGRFITLTQNTDIGIQPSVPSGHDITTYICEDGITSIPNCLDFSSSYLVDAHFAVFNSPVGTATSVALGTRANAALNIAGDFSYWKYTILSAPTGGNVQLYAVSGGHRISITDAGGVGVEQTINPGFCEPLLYFVSFDGPFTGKICAP